MRFAIVGHSFIARMAGNSLLQSDDVQLLGILGATTWTLLHSKKIRDLDVDRLLLQIGGNDIGPTSDPDDIVSDICDVVPMSLQKGCQVIVGSLFQRYRPRHMTPENYEIQRSRINTRLCKLFRNQDYVAYWKLRGLQHLTAAAFKDGVHLTQTLETRYARQLKLALYCSQMK
ncbi:hypothetical protein KP79_PYT19569 [Mizuhopecten yessoensis]|uniref:SGNH hydrolase-type esterase domain-containing protein n=1 Tax=Mizuhopecten yessoensis TaxID=6573 RepID=A0A210QJZ8_MIZYE|nr:hypothetical protein KP79_PYT19569 [Mizuhopecten yessoensis]